MRKFAKELKQLRQDINSRDFDAKHVHSRCEAIIKDIERIVVKNDYDNKVLQDAYTLNGLALVQLQQGVDAIRNLLDAIILSKRQEVTSEIAKALGVAQKNLGSKLYGVVTVEELGNPVPISTTIKKALDRISILYSLAEKDLDCVSEEVLSSAQRELGYYIGREYKLSKASAAHEAFGLCLKFGITSSENWQKLMKLIPGLEASHAKEAAEAQLEFLLADDTAILGREVYI